jgi:lysozyme family protein
MGGTTGGPKDMPDFPTSADPKVGDGPDTETGLPGRGGTDGFGGFGRTFLKDGVGRGQTNGADDVFRTSDFLAENGLLPAPTRDADESFLRGVESGQKLLNELAGGGLQIDGIAKPWGPTEVLSQRAVSSGKMKPPRPAMETETVSITQSSIPQGAQIKPASPPPPTATPTWPVNDGKNATFNDLLAHTKKIEGGYANRPKSADPGGPTKKGISQKTLDGIRAKYPQWKLPQHTKNLTDEQIDGIYRFDYFDLPKLDKMAAIPGMDPRLLRHVYDAGAQHSPARAGRWLQQALDKHLGTDLRSKSQNGALRYDGNIGPQTRSALAEAIKRGKLKDVNNEIARTREAFMRGLPEFPANPGWIARAKSFSIP